MPGNFYTAGFNAADPPTITGTLNLQPASGPALKTDAAIHAGDGAHHIDSQGTLRIFGVGTVNDDDSLPTNYELLEIGWNSGTGFYEIGGKAGGSGVVQKVTFPNGANTPGQWQINGRNFASEIAGQFILNDGLGAVASAFNVSVRAGYNGAGGATFKVDNSLLPAPAAVGFEVKLATSPTANALEINSSSGSGGDVLNVPGTGGFNFGGGNTSADANGNFFSVSVSSILCMSSAQGFTNRNIVPVCLYNGNTKPVVIGSSSTSLDGDVVDMALPVKLRAQIRLANFASAPSSPDEGDKYFDTSLHKERVFNGTTWETVTST